jgi:hypothetical protein
MAIKHAAAWDQQKMNTPPAYPHRSTSNRMDNDIRPKGDRKNVDTSSITPIQ